MDHSRFRPTLCPLGLLDQKNGESSRLNAERWFAVNALEGGAAGLINRVKYPCPMVFRMPCSRSSCWIRRGARRSASELSDRVL